MTDVKEKSCRLCLKIITDESFEMIDNSIRDILYVLFPTFKFDGESKEVICNVCRRKLNAASEFKSTCLNTDNTIMLYADSEKMLQLDLREVYMREKRSELADISCGQKICRLCMQPIEREFRCIREVELEAIEKLAPEMNINIVKDPTICKPCFVSLCTYNSFLEDCSEVEEKMKSIFGSSAAGSQMDTSPLDLFVKTENLDKEFDEMKMSIKAECVDIKPEDEERSDTPLHTSDIVPFEESDCKNEEEDGCKDENGSEVITKQEHKVLYKCEIPFTAHCARRETDLEVYKCESCDYETENRKLLQKHLSRHKDPSQVHVYRCDDCDYKTRHNSHFKQHQLKHKDPSQVQTYRCHDCNYETIRNSHFKQHQLKHKDSSQVQMYRCKDCDFETKYRRCVEKTMTDVKETSCRLCLKNITDESFEVINDIIRNILDVLLLKLKFDDESKEVICNVCRRKLNTALEFKSTCLNTDNTIIQYVDSEKMLQLELREVYTQEKKNELVCSQKICRLCMHPVESEFRCICQEELEAIQKLIPEMYVNIIKDPVVCKPCFDSLSTHNSFLKDCSEVEEKIKSIFVNSATESQTDTSPLDSFVKTENLDKEFDIKEMEMSIKTESIDIKSEDEERSDTPLLISDIVPFEESDCKNEEEDRCKHENGSEVKTRLERKVLYKCDKCIFETESEMCFTTHCARHENNLRAYECESCEYETENKKLFRKHLLKHKDSWQIQMYRCKDCNYETKLKSYFKRHQLKHKDPSQVQMYR
ncbi:PR domain zinc finger protein 5-like, partial [Anoplophora glabripennis]|uniref:PR domain zinc finger protein 5-like n=1 Tax=Anoplophora glabripennis TaxID=217634 RepID=UPI000C761DC2